MLLKIELAIIQIICGGLENQLQIHQSDEDDRSSCRIWGYLASLGYEVNPQTWCLHARIEDAFPDYSEMVADAAKLPSERLLPLARLGERHRCGSSRICGSCDSDINMVIKWPNSANSVFFEELGIANSNCYLAENGGK